MSCRNSIIWLPGRLGERLTRPDAIVCAMR